MPLILHQKAPEFSSIITPPTTPDPTPDKTTYPDVIQATDRLIWRSLPLIDKLVLKGVLLPEHYLTPQGVGKAAAVYASMDEALLKYLEKPWLAGDGKHKPLKMSGKKRRSVLFEIKTGPRNTTATLRLYRDTTGEYPTWKYVFELNPRKLGPEGLAGYLLGVATILPDVMPERLLADARIRHIDVAVDLVGVMPGDLVAKVPKRGKTQTIRANDGTIETIYLFEKKWPPKVPPASSTYQTHGPTRLRLYDRKALKEDTAKSPPFGQTPITRVEVPKAWGDTLAPVLADLPHLPNILAKVQVQFIGNLPEISERSFNQFVAAWQGVGETAAAKLGWKDQGKFVAALYAMPSPIVEASVWQGWGAGIALLGLDKWVKLALDPEGPGSGDWLALDV